MSPHIYLRPHCESVWHMQGLFCKAALCVPRCDQSHRANNPLQQPPSSSKGKCHSWARGKPTNLHTHPGKGPQRSQDLWEKGLVKIILMPSPQQWGSYARMISAQKNKSNSAQLLGWNSSHVHGELWGSRNCSNIYLCSQGTHKAMTLIFMWLLNSMRRLWVCWHGLSSQTGWRVDKRTDWDQYEVKNCSGISCWNSPWTLWRLCK